MEVKSNHGSLYEEHISQLISEKPVRKQVVFYSIIKRTMDISLSLVCLPFVLFLVAVFSIFIKLETPGPVFYSQLRLGQYGSYFKVYKLRSMYVDAESDGPKWAVEDDPRVTKVGKLIRRTRIDELPQVINILKGDMSLVGPRPERPIFTALFEGKYPGFVNRLAVKPGLTGIAQVNGGYSNSPKEKLKLDMYYIENQGIRMDIKILFQTICIILSGHGAR